jgi:hypothetical protein
MGIDDTFPLAFAKSQMAANSALPAPEAGLVFVSVADRDKNELIPIARSLTEMGYRLIATRGTALGGQFAACGHPTANRLRAYDCAGARLRGRLLCSHHARAVFAFRITPAKG